MGNSDEEISRGSFRPGTGVFFYLDRQMEDKERSGVRERWEKMVKGWEKVRKSLRNLCVSLWRSV